MTCKWHEWRTRRCTWQLQSSTFDLWLLTTLILHHQYQEIIFQIVLQYLSYPFLLETPISFLFSNVLIDRILGEVPQHGCQLLNNALVHLSAKHKYSAHSPFVKIRAPNLKVWAGKKLAHPICIFDASFDWSTVGMSTSWPVILSDVARVEVKVVFIYAAIEKS